MIYVAQCVAKCAMKPARTFATIALTLALPIALQGCATTASLLDPQTPNVTLEKIKPLNFSFDKQKLELTLNVDNPNAFSLPLNTLVFAAQLAGDHIADGASNQRVTIPANGSAQMSVIVTTSLSKLISKIRTAADEGGDISYNVKGNLKLDNYPKIIPFNNSGKIENPLL